ncbi:MAG: hypothetical protein OXF72_06985, partial [Gammaproteobacteria bacterium]|nr:hypothetical protein [Gammaproteobacteria bacterium]MCY4323462.1 hypothetical protein [Gammaproteobacteria bacterium]
MWTWTWTCVVGVSKFAGSERHFRLRNFLRRRLPGKVLSDAHHDEADVGTSLNATPLSTRISC